MPVVVVNIFLEIYRAVFYRGKREALKYIQSNEYNVQIDLNPYLVEDDKMFTIFVWNELHANYFIEIHLWR